MSLEPKSPLGYSGFAEVYGRPAAASPVSAVMLDTTSDPQAMLRHNLVDGFGLPSDAVDWLMGLWTVIQALDDVADGTPGDPRQAYSAAWLGLVGLQTMPYFLPRSALLLPLMGVQVLKWQASDEAERAGLADARSYMWRAGFYDVVLAVCIMQFGAEQASRMPILQMYGETFEGYMQEMDHA